MCPTHAPGMCPSSSNADIKHRWAHRQRVRVTPLWAELTRVQSRGFCADGSALPSSSQLGLQRQSGALGPGTDTEHASPWHQDPMASDESNPNTEPPHSQPSSISFSSTALLRSKPSSPRQGHCPPKLMGTSCCAALPCQLQLQPTTPAPLRDALIHLKAGMRTSRARQETQYTATAAEWEKSFGKSQPLPAGGTQNWSEALPHPFQGCEGVSRQQVTQILTGSAQDMTHPPRHDTFTSE